MYELIYSAKFFKQLSKLQKQDSKNIKDKVAELTNNKTQWVNVKKLVNFEYDYRLRVGNFRIFFNFDDDIAEIVCIEEVLKRDDKTYKRR